MGMPECLAFFIRGALRDPHHPAEGNFLFGAFIRFTMKLRDAENGHPLAGTGSLGLPLGKSELLPCLSTPTRLQCARGAKTILPKQTARLRVGY